MELSRERFDFRDLLADVAGRFEDTLARTGRKLRVDAPSVAGRWDRSRIDQIVTNLIGNAVKYGGDAPITVGVQERDGWLVLRVHDDGPGIPPEEIARVFERFVQGSGAQQAGGLGLGLYITRKIVEAHGCTIRAESRQGAGTTFWVELPREPPEPTEAEKAGDDARATDEVLPALSPRRERASGGAPREVDGSAVASATP